MEEKLTITAISGWAVPETWFAEQIKEAFPGSDIHVIYRKTQKMKKKLKVF